MIYMIRLLAILILIAGCSSRDYIEMPVRVYQSIKGQDLVISEEFLDSREFSFIKINIGRNIVGIMSLVNIDKGVYEWVGEDSSQRVFTKNGRIVKTIGLKHNIEIINYHDLSFDSQSGAGEYLTRLTNPTGIFSQKYHFFRTNTLDFNQSHLNKLFRPHSKIQSSYIIEENFKTELYRWSNQNIYWLDDDFNVVKTIQSIHPYLPKITIVYFFKY